MACYVNGTRELSFKDTAQAAVFSSANRLIQFMMDDTVTGGSEHPKGVLERLEIFDGALTDLEVAGLFQARAPDLRIARSSRQFLVSWTDYVHGFKLEGADRLGPTAAWQAVGLPQQANGLVQSITLTNNGSAGAAFFRLVK